MKKIVLVVTIMSLLYGCASLVSGGKTIPVAPTDPERISDARFGLFAPNILASQSTNRPFLLVKFAFDGTLNDEKRVPDDERRTIVSYIASRVSDTHYYRGVGMQSRYKNMVDAAVGHSMFNTAESARAKFFNEVSTFLDTHPNGEIRVFVTGFSRGAATARHFMNIVEQQWQRECADQLSSARPSLRFYALLYDTVSTGQHGNPQLLLGLTRHLNYLVHFVASDEPRDLYKVDIDLPALHDSSWGTGVRRVNTIFLPGAHSDVGASYPDGIGDNYRQITDNLLSTFGLITDQCFDNSTDSLAAGKHDSRGILDKLFKVPSPNTFRGQERPHRFISPTPLTPEEVADIQASNKRLIDANLFRPTVNLSTGVERFGFNAMRDGDQLRLTGVPSNLVVETARLIPAKDGNVVFEFAFKMVPQKINQIRFSPKVISKIKPSGSTVGVTYLVIEGGQRFNTFVDDILVEQVDWQLKSNVQLRNRPTCASN